MDFIDQIKQFSKRVDSMKGNIQTEEATKTSIIMPLFALLGYDVFNPDEFIPEFTADVGIKKGEKVDYAILNDGEPIILIEAKWIGEDLQKHDSQLFRYFGTSKAKFAILTNGQIYKFFTDLDAPNKMDEKPFLEIDILDIKESQVAEIKKFHKSNFNVSEIFDTASELRYSNEFKIIMNNQLQQPSDDFVRLFLSETYEGVKTQSIIDKFRPILKKALNNYISEIMSDKIKTALEPNTSIQILTDDSIVAETSEPIIKERRIVTTNEELEAFFIIKTLLKSNVSIDDITYKDTESYFTVLYRGNARKWICRVFITSAQLSLVIPDENRKEVKYPLENLYDIENHKEALINSVLRYVQ